VDFFTGVGATEGGSPSTSAPSQEEQAVVTKRLLLGVALSAATVAFALVPTDALKPPPAKPLFFYLTPLVRIQVLAHPSIGAPLYPSPSRRTSSSTAI
jgi:hypothetical protein